MKKLLHAFCSLAFGAALLLTSEFSGAQAAASYPTVNVKTDCGARGDGKTNDTAAFQKAAQLIESRGGGKLIIPKAVYIVGRQTHTEGKTPYYVAQSIFHVKNLKYLLVEGNDATVRLAPGLRYGAFDPQTGQVYTKMPNTDRKYAVGVGTMFDISQSRNVTVRRLDLDGNCGSFVLGGGWGDTGRQLSGDGLAFYKDAQVQVSHVHSHHQGRDGILIGWGGLKESDPATPHALTDCVFEYNGRQGLSWVGGRGLRAVRCRFNHTGRVKIGDTIFASAPSAGVDIEAEDSICRDGDFEDCEFVDNNGCGLVAASGNGGYSRFQGCTFWGTTNWSAWSAKPGLKYENCNFYGSAVKTFGSPDPNLATSFIDCRFEDKPWTSGQVYGRYLLDANKGGDNVRFENCTFLVHSPKRRPLWFTGGKPLVTGSVGLAK